MTRVKSPSRVDTWYRSLDGDIVHRASCFLARGDLRWRAVDGLTESELDELLTLATWTRKCRRCFVVPDEQKGDGDG